MARVSPDRSDPQSSRPVTVPAGAMTVGVAPVRQLSTEPKGQPTVGYEIDFLPVGDGSRSGDAIVLRYGNLHGPRSEQTVIVVDGGFTDDGEALVDHIKQYYGTEVVDIVVSTHPDQDHVCGLKVVLEKLAVKELWMHRPWLHSQTLASLRSQAFKSAQLSDKVEKSLQGESELEDLATALGIPIIEPFAGVGTADGAFVVLGPTEEYYDELIAEIQGNHTVAASLGAFLKAAADAIRGWLFEDHETETLTDSGSTSPQNNSSAICMLAVDDHYALLTADAGIPALEGVADRLEAAGFVPGQLNFIQVPHHGSRRNVGPAVLDRLLGPTGKLPEESVGTAVVSAAPEGEPKHPHKRVMNAFTRRGYPVHGTQGITKWHHHDAPGRSNFSTSTPFPFYDKVEDDDE
jgi:beta-lactamase superfamily II metal-dependent hydrolase